MTAEKEQQKKMKLACNAAAFRQTLPACPFCGGTLMIVSRNETFGSIAVAVQCDKCKKRRTETVKTN